MPSGSRPCRSSLLLRPPATSTRSSPPSKTAGKGRRPLPVRPDPLTEAAARRHELTRSRAVQALRELDRAGVPVTFASIARAAGVSRSWLYTQPDISGQIRRLRQQADEAGSAGIIPAAQRAT